MSSEMMRREVREAVQAGERALVSLYMAQDKLKNAKNWGLFDMLGGGFFTTLIKRAKMDEAQEFMEQAKQDLEIFQRELRDVQVPLNMRMEIGGFLSFADFFFDGLVADYLVQNKIGEAKEQVDDAIRQVEHILGSMKQNEFE